MLYGRSDYFGHLLTVISDFVTKLCDPSGHWAGKTPGVYDNPWGWTNFYPCMRINHSVMKVRKQGHTITPLSGRT